MSGNTSLTFAPAWRDLPACVFEDTTFPVDILTLHRLAQVYPLPATLHRAVLKRQVEFLAGRACAQQAIARLTGCPKALIPAQADRSPGWPAGVVGAITHTEGYAAALVAPRALYDGIGLDCECVLTADKLPLQKHICLSHELEDLQAQHNTWSPEALLTLIFSAKESLYKCLYPQVLTYFGFHAARVIALDIERRTFTIQLERDLHTNIGAHTQWTGSFVQQQHLLMTGIVSPGGRRTGGRGLSDRG